MNPSLNFWRFISGPIAKTQSFIFESSILHLTFVWQSIKQRQVLCAWSDPIWITDVHAPAHSLFWATKVPARINSLVLELQNNCVIVFRGWLSKVGLKMMPRTSLFEHWQNFVPLSNSISAINDPHLRQAINAMAPSLVWIKRGFLPRVLPSTAPM